MRAHNFSRKQRRAIGERADWICELCGLPAIPGQADHILPVIEGGASETENGRWLCLPCHKVKTRSDVSALRKSERVRDRHTGARLPTKRKIPGSRGTGIRKPINGPAYRVIE